MEELNKILENGNFESTQDNIIHQIQQLILHTMQKLFPKNYDFNELHNIYNSTHQNTTSIEITYNLVEYFIRLVSCNFINRQNYDSLQQQTQKQQAMIRQHIKNENEIKLYIEDMQNKKNQEPTSQHYKQQIVQIMRQKVILENKIDILQKQKIKMIRKQQDTLQEISKLSLNNHYVIGSSQQEQINIKNNLLSKYYNNNDSLRSSHQNKIIK